MDSTTLDIDALYRSYLPEVDAVLVWCEEMYSSYFREYFQNETELYSRLKSEGHVITDTELEMILTDVPLDLFNVSEALSQFKLKREVVKLKLKDKEMSIYRQSTQTTDTKRKEEAAFATLEDKLLINAIDSVVTRVENEISFSRELIMSAKKIWDARRNAEASNPVKPISNDSEELPEYPSSISNTYIHG